MAQAQITYSAAAFNGTPAHNVDLVLTYDPASIDSNGYYTATAASGTYTVLNSDGTVNRVDTITGLAPAGTVGGANNLFQIAAQPYVDRSGINYTISNSSDTFSNNNGVVDFYSQGTTGNYYYSEDGYTLGDSNVVSNVSTSPVCYCSGTRILIWRDNAEMEVAVDDLSVGDTVVTASGHHRPIRWVGRRTLNPRIQLEPAHAMPVRIRANAFGSRLPVEDLCVSPAHGIALDVLGEVLIPASALINGSTIIQEKVDSVTYWHVELDSHDLLIAEGQPAESYLDMGNRAFFAHHSGTGALVDLTAVPDGDPSKRTHADYCRPFHDDGPLVDVVRAQLRRRAQGLGWRLEQPETWAEAYLEVDGQIVRPKARGLSACFVLPADAREVFLVSPTSVPREVSDNSDPRSLGLCLKGLRLDDGLNEPRAVALDDPLLTEGYHALWADHRWTSGRARVPSELLVGLEGPVFLRVDLNAPALPRWIEPEGSRDSEAYDPDGGTTQNVALVA